MMNKPVTLGDIAKRLGVSTVTVSNALAGRKGVSEEMRDLIIRTASQLGYQRERRKKADGRTAGFYIGVIICERYLDGGLTFYWEMYQRVAAEASRHGCFTVFEILRNAAEMDGDLPRIVEEKKIDALIVMGSVKHEYRTVLKERVHPNMPVLFLDFYDDERWCDSVISSGFMGMYRMTNLLFDAGHRKIAYVGNIMATSGIMDRYQGYVKSLLEHGVEERPDWVISDRETRLGQVSVRLPDELPEAFACNSDYTAAILAAELEKAGYRIPEDISIVGYDDFLHFGSMQGRLTTYRVDMGAMAERSIRIMLKRITEEGSYVGMWNIDGQVIVRESVRDKNTD